MTLDIEEKSAVYGEDVEIIVKAKSAADKDINLNVLTDGFFILH